jgi:hypothetical protein
LKPACRVAAQTRFPWRAAADHARADLDDAGRWRVGGDDRPAIVERQHGLQPGSAPWRREDGAQGESRRRLPDNRLDVEFGRQFDGRQLRQRIQLGEEVHRIRVRDVPECATGQRRRQEMRSVIDDTSGTTARNQHAVGSA